MGVFVETVRLPVGSEGVRFSLAGEPRVDQLVLEDAPYSPPRSRSDPSSQPSCRRQRMPSTRGWSTQRARRCAGASITFAVISGPNTGIFANVVTDANGAASFSYSSDVAGADRIRASYDDGIGTPLEADALTFWDADCNANQIPDTCDLACDGFAGECAAFAGCGGGVDADSNGVLDECSPPPPRTPRPTAARRRSSPGCCAEPTTNSTRSRSAA